MAEWLVLALACLPLVVVVLATPVHLIHGQRVCDRLNAENALRWESWKALTPEDRAWLLDNGATPPSSTRWEMR